MNESSNLSTAKAKPFGRNQLRIISAMRQGATLNRFFENDGEVYFLEGHGEVSKDSIQRLKARGVLEDSGDGMFGVGMSFDLAG